MRTITSVNKILFSALKVQLCQNLLKNLYNGKKSHEWRETCQSVLEESVILRLMGGHA